MSAPASKILVIGPSWVGDMVMAQSLFMRLKQYNHETKIDVVAPDWSMPLLNRMPEVRQGIGLPVGHGELGLRQRWGVARRLKNIGYNQAIVLPRSYKSGLLPFFAGIPLRTGYRGEWRYGIINDIRPMAEDLDQTVKRFVALGLNAEDCAKAPGVEWSFPRPKLVIDKENQASKIKELGLNPDVPAVSIMPGAEYGPAKQWSAESFAAVTEKLTGRNFQVWMIGSAKDFAVAEKIIELAGGGGINLCGKTRLPDAIDLIAFSKLAVSNDSGLMHVAAAVGCPLVAIYGSSSPYFTPPLTDKAAIVYLDVDCSPCFQRTCKFGHYKCLADISVQQVLESAEQISGLNLN